MTYTIVANPDVEAAFRKIKTKDAARFEQLVTKLREIGENPEPESRSGGLCRDGGAFISGTTSSSIPSTRRKG